ncbi:MAG: regulatory protein [Phycisphaerales bacterium]|jgi:regulatory protein
MSYGRTPKKPLYVLHAEVFESADGAGVVTNLKAMPSDPSRVKVYVDQVKVCRVSAEDCVSLGLGKGAEWTAELASGVLAASAAHEAERSGINMLANRGRSEKLIERGLRQRGHTTEGIHAGIERLRDKGYVNDEAYAAQVVRSELRQKPAGRRLLEMKLRHAGITDDITRDAVAEGFEGRSEREDALELARKQARSLIRHEPEVALRRLVGRLARRGFGGGVCYEVARTALDEARQEADQESES